jgi:hypothetical protein
MGDEPETKKIAIKGGAVADFEHSKGLRKRTTRKQKGGDTPSGTEIPITNTNMSKITNITKVIKSGGSLQKGGNDSSIPASTLPGSNPNPPSADIINKLPAASQVGTLPPTVRLSANANNQPTVRLSANANNQPTVNQPPPITPSSTEQKGGKLVLAPKKKTRSKLVLAPPTEKKGKRGHTRKIRLQLSNMKKRFSTAKVIHKDSKEKSIEDIRKLLEEAKLIKPAKEGKKVPEEILRSIYKDYLLLRNKAL